jgi:hypothetical protein
MFSHDKSLIIGIRKSLIQEIRGGPRVQFSDICRIFGAKTSDIFSHDKSHDKSLIIGYSQILNLGFRRGLSN